MPFTISHAAAVLPLATGRPGRVLVPAALVIGSMVPDLPYFIPPYRGGSWSHAASGPVTIDLVLGLVVLVVWQLLLYRPLVDFAPRLGGRTTAGTTTDSASRLALGRSVGGDRRRHSRPARLLHPSRPLG